MSPGHGDEPFGFGTLSSTWLAQRASKARKSTTSSLRRSFKSEHNFFGIAQVFPDFPIFPDLPDFAYFFCVPGSSGRWKIHAESSAHPCAGSPPHRISTLSAHQMAVPGQRRTENPR